MHCTNNPRKVVELNGDAITLYTEYSEQNFQNNYLTTCKFNVKIKIHKTRIKTQYFQPTFKPHWMRSFSSDNAN